MYSAMGNKELTSLGPDDKVKVDHIPPFWAVKMADRDLKNMVNMQSIIEEYDFQYPGGKMTLKLPFLTNSKELAEGELLVLPYDGGIPEIICESFPQHAPTQTTPSR